MIVRHIPLAAHPLLERMAAALEAARPPAAVQTIGDWRADLAAGIPGADRDLAAAQTTGHMPEAQAAFVAGAGAQVRAAIYYPAGGGMGWHTNSACPGWRVYVPRVRDASPVSGMVTADGSFPDVAGYANMFFVARDWRRSWHAVYALTERYCIGVRVDDELAAELLGSPIRGL